MIKINDTPKRLMTLIRPVLDGEILRDTTDLIIDGNKATITLVPTEDNIELLNDKVGSCWNVRFDVAIGSNEDVNLRVYDRCTVRINKATGRLGEYTSIELLIEEVKDEHENEGFRKL